MNINIKNDFRNPYDFVKWSDNKGFSIGYRLMDEKGLVVFDGEVTAEGIGGGSFTVGILITLFIMIVFSEIV